MSSSPVAFPYRKAAGVLFGFLRSILKAFKNSGRESSLPSSRFAPFGTAEGGRILRRAGENVPASTAGSPAAAEAAK